MRVVLRYPPCVQLQVQPVQSQTSQVGTPAQRHQDLVHLDPVVTGADPQPVADPFQFGRRTEPDGEFPTEDLMRQGCDLRIADTAESLRMIDARYPDPESGEGLAHLQTDRAQADHCDRVGQLRLLEQVFHRQQPVLEVAPMVGDHPARAGGDDDGLGMDHLTLHDQRMRIEKAGIAFDQTLTHLIGGVGQHQIDEHVPHVP